MKIKDSFFGVTIGLCILSSIPDIAIRLILWIFRSLTR